MATTGVIPKEAQDLAADLRRIAMGGAVGLASRGVRAEVTVIVLYGMPNEHTATLWDTSHSHHSTPALAARLRKVIDRLRELSTVKEEHIEVQGEGRAPPGMMFAFSVGLGRSLERMTGKQMGYVVIAGDLPVEYGGNGGADSQWHTNVLPASFESMAAMFDVIVSQMESPYGRNETTH